MYRKDLITAEIERLAQVLARIMSLKLDGDFANANSLFNETMAQSFLLPHTILDDRNLDAFKIWLSESNLSAEKLDSLSEFLFYELGMSAERNQIIAPKLNLIYQVLAEQHKIVHLVNFHRQEIIQQYL